MTTDAIATESVTVTEIVTGSESVTVTVTVTVSADALVLPTLVDFVGVKEISTHTPRVEATATANARIDTLAGTVGVTANGTAIEALPDGTFVVTMTTAWLGETDTSTTTVDGPAGIVEKTWVPRGTSLDEARLRWSNASLPQT